MSSVRTFINIGNKYDRVILLVDMDCFYCQVEEKLDPSLAGKPIAVVQYNTWRGGGIIAVNYAARAKGVTRHMRGDEAKQVCPDIVLVRVPNIREKSDLTKYREAGKEVANVLQKSTELLERASVDEAYLDITVEVNKRMQDMNAGTFNLEPNKLTNTYAVGYSNIGEYISEITSKINNPHQSYDYRMDLDAGDSTSVKNSDLRLLIGAAIANQIRKDVKNTTGYDCSVGIAHNKIMAKLACGMNKPNKQTILPLGQINSLFQVLPVGKIRGLGAKFGDEICEKLKVKFLGDLLSFSEAELQRHFEEKSGSWLYLICRGIDLEAVCPRFYSKSIGCCKKFPGRNAISGIKTLEHWLKELSNEVSDRLENDFAENNRRAKQMVVSFVQDINGEDVNSSRSCPLTNYEAKYIQEAALDLIKRNTQRFFSPGSEFILNNSIKFLGLSAGKFEKINSGNQGTLQQMFANQKKKESLEKNDTDEKSSDSARTIIYDISSEENSSLKESKTDIETERSTSQRSFFASLLKKPKQETLNTKSNTTVTKEDNIVFSETFDKTNSGNRGTLERMFAKQKQSAPIEEKDVGRQIPNKDGSASSKTMINNEMFNQKPISTISPSPSDASAVSDINRDKKGNMMKSFFVSLLNKRETPVLNPVGQLGKQNMPTDGQLGKQNLPADTKKIPIVTETTENFLEATIPRHLPTHNSENAHQAKLVDNSLQSENATPTTNFKRKSNSSIPPSKIIKSFQEEYPEMAIPEIRDEFFITCDTCNHRILADSTSIQLHKDKHLAEEISRKQREEYRAGIQARIHKQALEKNTKQSVNKKQKSDPSENGGNIKKFMQPINQLSNQCPPQHMICSKCQKAVNEDLYSEHLDFHFAKELQNNLKQLDESLTKKGKTDLDQKKPQIPVKSGVKRITEFFTQF